LLLDEILAVQQDLDLDLDYVISLEGLKFDRD